MLSLDLHFESPPEIWPFALMSLRKFCEDNGIKLMDKPRDPIKPKSSTNWFLTVNPVDIDSFRVQLRKKLKSKTIKRYAGCFEHTKKGVPHCHVIVEFHKTKSLAETKRVFNFESVMQPPKYKWKTFDYWEKILPYLEKAPVADI